MQKSVCLVGFMGTGKTAVGKALATSLNLKFVELDVMISQKAGRSIPQIFHENGEIAFRELEIAAVKEVAGKKNLVIACGGGVVLNKINIDRLKKQAVIVLLKASPATIWRRVEANQEERPILKDVSKAADLVPILRKRLSYYTRAADITIDTTKLDIPSVVEQIIIKLKEYESKNQ